MSVSFLNSLLAKGIDLGIAAAANKAEIVAEAIKLFGDAAGVAENAVETVVANANLGPFLNMFKSQIAGAIKSEVSALLAQAPAEADVLWNLIIAAAQAEAKRLGS